MGESSSEEFSFDWGEIAKRLSKIDKNIQESIILLDELIKEQDFSPTGVTLCKAKLQEAKGWIDGLA